MAENVKKLKLKPATQLVLSVEVDEAGMLVVFEPRLNIYGVGSSLEEAVADFTSMMRDLWTELEASEATLSNHLRAQLAHLRTLLAIPDGENGHI
jgi:hypothetical protein